MFAPTTTVSPVFIAVIFFKLSYMTILHMILIAISFQWKKIPKQEPWNGYYAKCQTSSHRVNLRRTFRKKLMPLRVIKKKLELIIKNWSTKCVDWRQLKRMLKRRRGSQNKGSYTCKGWTKQKEVSQAKFKWWFDYEWNEV